MSFLKIEQTPFLRGKVRMPGDKSISHRAIIMASLACGRSHIRGLLSSEDVKSTLNIFRRLGAKIRVKNTHAIVYGTGLYGLKAPRTVLDAGNSGTTARLMMGVLAGQNFTSAITGDSSLKARPMRRVTEPLQKMGANISGRRGTDRLPLTIRGGNLNGITYTLPIPSAQVKSSILLAGLFSSSPVTVIEPVPCRDHTEIMFKYFGLPIKKTGKRIILDKIKPFHARSIAVPGDISSAAFFIAAGLILKDSSIAIENVGLNPLRIGLVNILKRIGADIKIIKYKSQNLLEPSGVIIIDAQPLLKPFHLKARDIPILIDEIPILSVLATQIKGTSSIRGAGELRVKETDRIKAIAWNLRRLGADIKELPDGLIIRGGVSLHGACVKSFGDHRMAMSMAIAGLISCGGTKILDTACINISFPDFIPLLKKLGGKIKER